MAVFVLEFSSDVQNAGMIMPQRQRSETAEEIKYSTAVLVIVIHSFRPFDLHLMEAEQFHEMKLSWVQMADK
jgi:hypothetical protein